VNPFRHHYKDIDITIGSGFTPGGRTKKDDSERMNSLHNTLNQLINGPFLIFHLKPPHIIFYDFP
jgi:hypothetical protein